MSLVLAARKGHSRLHSRRGCQHHAVLRFNCQHWGFVTHSHGSRSQGPGERHKRRREAGRSLERYCSGYGTGQLAGGYHVAVAVVMRYVQHLQRPGCAVLHGSGLRWAPASPQRRSKRRTHDSLLAPLQVLARSSDPRPHHQAEVTPAASTGAQENTAHQKVAHPIQPHLAPPRHQHRLVGVPRCQ
jgi:hypothetical protein